MTCSSGLEAEFRTFAAVGGLTLAGMPQIGFKLVLAALCMMHFPASVDSGVTKSACELQLR